MFETDSIKTSAGDVEITFDVELMDVTEEPAKATEGASPAVARSSRQVTQVDLAPGLLKRRGGPVHVVFFPVSIRFNTNLATAVEAMAEVIEGHIRYNVADPDEHPCSEKAKAVQELIDVVATYLR